MSFKDGVYDPDSLEGYSCIHNEYGMGDAGSFGIKIYVKDTERDKLEIPVNRHGDKSKFGTDGDWKCVYDAVKLIKDGIRSQTSRMKPDFEAKKLEEKLYYKDIFDKAGIGPIYMQEMPNVYCKEFCCLHKPSFDVTTLFGRIHIGWRKRVINIDWTNSDVKWSGEEIFPDEHVTKSSNKYSDDKTRFIHAYGDAKAIEYLKRLHEVVLTKWAPPPDPAVLKEEEP